MFSAPNSPITITGWRGKNLYDRSKVEIAYAAMSPNNSLFSSVGATLEAKPNSRYDYGTLFLC